MAAAGFPITYSAIRWFLSSCVDVKQFRIINRVRVVLRLSKLIMSSARLVSSVSGICVIRCHFLQIVSALYPRKRTVYPKKYAHGFCFAVLCCGYTLTDFPISIRLTSLALWQSNDCPCASKATLMNMDKYFIWIHYERLHNHNKAKHNKTVCIFLGINCTSDMGYQQPYGTMYIRHKYFSQ